MEVIDDKDMEYWGAYCADAGKEKDEEPVFNETSGLSIDKLPPGATLDKLWNVVAQP